MTPSHAKLRLKSAPQNVTFKQEKLYEKVIHYIVAINALADFRIVTHSHVKIILCETNNIFYSLGNCVWHKMNNMFWKYIKNKGNGHVGQFSKFCLPQQLFAFKEFRMETRLRNILRTTNVTEFIKTILENSSKVLLGPYILAVRKRPVFFLTVVEF